MAETEDEKKKKKEQKLVGNILDRLRLGGETWEKGRKKMKSGEMEQPVDAQGRPIIIED